MGRGRREKERRGRRGKGVGRREGQQRTEEEKRGGRGRQTVVIARGGGKWSRIRSRKWGKKAVRRNWNKLDGEICWGDDRSKHKQKHNIFKRNTTVSNENV